MCVLRASGAEFDVDGFLSTSPLVPCSVFHRGTPAAPLSNPDGRKCEKSGLTISVSDASWSDLPAQIEDAERYLTDNHAELERLVSLPDVTDVRLDFPADLRIDGGKVLFQFECFPASLIRLAGALGMGIELSIYHCRDTVDSTDNLDKSGPRVCPSGPVA